MSKLETEYMEAVIDIAKQLRIANSLKKVEMCYNFNSYIGDKPSPDIALKEKIINDFNQAIDVAFDA